MKKKVLTILLCVALIVTMMPATGFAESGENLITGACGSDATYVFNARYGELTINGSGSVTESPWAANGWYQQIRTINIGENIAEFHDERAGFLLEDLNNLVAINVQEGNTAYKSIDGVLFTADGKTMECFPVAKAVEYYEVPEGVETLNFRQTKYLQTVKLPSTITKLSRNPFYDSNVEYVVFDTRNTTFVSKDGIVFSADMHELILSPPNYQFSDGKYIVPQSVQRIAAGAFINNQYLHEIKYEDQNGIVDIGDSAFSGSGLIQVSIPENISSVGVSTFSNCKELRQVEFLGNKVSEISWCAFAFSDSLETFEFSEGLTYIGEGAFNGCVALHDISLPSS